MPHLSRWFDFFAVLPECTAAVEECDPRKKAAAAAAGGGGSSDKAAAKGGEWWEFNATGWDGIGLDAGNRVVVWLRG
jgi:hypothetical protein